MPAVALSRGGLEMEIVLYNADIPCEDFGRNEIAESRQTVRLRHWHQADPAIKPCLIQGFQRTSHPLWLTRAEIGCQSVDFRLVHHLYHGLTSLRPLTDRC